MINRACGVMMLLAWTAAVPVAADDLDGAERLLCTAMVATRCQSDGECTTAPPSTWNIPAFIEVDLERKQLSTTAASGLNRSTAIRHVERDGGMIFVQGVEGGRAFSFAITEATGASTYSVAAEGLTVGGFGACTPLPVVGSAR
jgi:hypothetical protein